MQLIRTSPFWHVVPNVNKNTNNTSGIIMPAANTFTVAFSYEIFLTTPAISNEPVNLDKNSSVIIMQFFKRDKDGKFDLKIWDDLTAEKAKKLYQLSFELFEDDEEVKQIEYILTNSFNWNYNTEKNYKK